MPAAMIESRSPQQRDDLVTAVPCGDRQAVKRAFAAARWAAPDWASGSAMTRANALTRAAAVADAADELTHLMVREVGKPIGEAAAEVTRAVGILRYHAQAALDPDGETYPPATGGPSLLLSRRRPRGVAGLITPWNFPVAIPLWKAAPVLAYGNAVVLKPAPEATAVALRVAELLNRSLPEDIFQVVPGGAQAGQSIMELADVVSFTGSVPVGHTVAQAAVARGIPVQAEMGGQNASVVLPDAEPAAAAAMIAGAAMGYAGQKCTATSRVIVVGDEGPFVEALVDAVQALKVGDPAEQGVAVGPVISPTARDEVVAASNQTCDAGGRILTGGRVLDREGWFVTPTILDGVTPDARVAQEEVFGPIALVLHAGTPEHAVEIANGVRYGLVTSVFTSDLDRALELVARLDTGLIRVNQPTSGVDFHAPFGGEKQSSIGPREQGKHARELDTAVHTITITPAGGRRTPTTKVSGP